MPLDGVHGGLFGVGDARQMPGARHVVGDAEVPQQRLGRRVERLPGLGGSACST
ncbi:hypothetical protein ACFOSC_24595 [Streptantibioticus rubrisoli]|uniref:Uncharacterized protein n=1 Tax=Streptantibioticus rubrisoli TaxID=1387313 RepID=A0ABT1PDV6_9ACTN|nr:hypothetical protein [Streptantibioticus rubrisoli]MCQ4042648.1 hypothetical protein [Streptantibioticus rubrisoli]